MLENIKMQVKDAAKELIDRGGLKRGEILVVGCSSSEIGRFPIGTHSNQEIGEAVFEAFREVLLPEGIYLAAQCCEHLNRALILEEEAALRYGYEPVNVVPQLKAGGSFATAAYRGFENPVAVERIRAHGGMDIGDTLIGMHLREVAVPLRLAVREIGGARVVCARTRPKFIGGERACYDKDLM